VKFSDAVSRIPNLITLARILAVPVTVYVILQGYMTMAFWIFVVAAASDALDGYLAKRLNAVTEIGAYLDPLADKALLVGTYIALAQADHIATWLVFLVVFRDLLIVCGALLFHTITQSLKMTPLFISKINTVAQLALASVVLAELGLDLRPDQGSDLGPAQGLAFLSGALVYIVVLTTFISGAAYVYKWGTMAVRMERDQ
jgi:cardiolipin synthase